MQAKTIKELKKGEYFTLKPYECPDDCRVYVRGDYVREEKKFSCFKFSDVNEERFYTGSKVVYTDFIF